MAIHDSVAVYTAADNIQASILRDVLADACIEAHVMDDVSMIGVWFGGLASQLHRPKVVVDRRDADASAEIVRNFDAEWKATGAAEKDSQKANDGVPITVVCDECGKSSSFPASERGSVQNCPHCRAYVDVGEVEFDGEWGDSEVTAR